MPRNPTIQEPEFDPVLGDIRHILDIGLRAERDTKAPHTQTGWMASHLGYCLQRQFLERAGVPPTVSDDAPRRQFWLGNTIEYALIRKMRQAGILLAEQVHLVSERHHASGYLDFIYGGFPTDDDPAELEGYSPAWIDYLVAYKQQVRDAYPDGIPTTAVELKSASGYSAGKQFAEGPQFHNTMQGGFYDVVMDEEPDQLPEGVKVDRTQLVVISKEDARMNVFDILGVHKERVLGRLDELNDAWPLELPRCTCGQEMGWEPKYCAYRRPGGRCCGPDLMDKATEEFWKIADAALTTKEGADG